MTDPILDGIAAQIRADDVEISAKAALALTLGRAGRSSDSEMLRNAAAQFEGAERLTFALAAALAHVRPTGVERADAGYRFEQGSDVLYVEDPVAAHFHAKGRWGPGLRPDPNEVCIARGALEPLVAHALAGGVVIVPIRPSAGRAQGALRIMRAGITTDASLRSILRWPAIRGLGVQAGRWGDEVAYETVPGIPEVVGWSDTLGANALLDLLARVRAGALSRGASP